ncbi:MAG: NUDIX domain-containing protein [Terriglobales bacterium]
MASVAGPQGVPDYIPPSHLRQLRGREQAAAVCYRTGSRGVEFLLVRTRGGRWTFPKGGIEPGLTQAQSAALEAFEEAGVHGRIEVVAFARYLRRTSSKSRDKSVLVFAYLCEVSRLGKPHEAKRNRTWFPAEKAKRRLQKGRTSERADELAAVVDRAVARVKRLHSGSESGGVPGGTKKDALRRVCLEAPDSLGWQGKVPAAIARYIRRQARSSAGIEVAANPQFNQSPPGSAQAIGRPLLRLTRGSADPE